MSKSTFTEKPGNHQFQTGNALINRDIHVIVIVNGFANVVGGLQTTVIYSDNSNFKIGELFELSVPMRKFFEPFFGDVTITWN